MYPLSTITRQVRDGRLANHANVSVALFPHVSTSLQIEVPKREREVIRKPVGLDGQAVVEAVYSRREL